MAFLLRWNIQLCYRRHEKCSLKTANANSIIFFPASESKGLSLFSLRLGNSDKGLSFGVDLLSTSDI